ncbi:MAG: winged helix-turn-helix transcriptional regulator [Cellvibrionaceae bacterium]
MYQLPKNPAQAKPNVFNDTCPARYLIGVLSGKWNLLIIDALDEKRWRNGELLRHLKGISQKMLTQSLRDLEQMNLVRRIDMGTVPPHVEYQLTSLGKELRGKICSFDRWIEKNMFALIKNNEGIPLEYF